MISQLSQIASISTSLAHIWSVTWTHRCPDLACAPPSECPSLTCSALSCPECQASERVPPLVEKVVEGLQATVAHCQSQVAHCNRPEPCPDQPKKDQPLEVGFSGFWFGVLVGVLVETFLLGIFFLVVRCCSCCVNQAKGRRKPSGKQFAISGGDLEDIVPSSGVRRSGPVTPTELATWRAGSSPLT